MGRDVPSALIVMCIQCQYRCCRLRTGLLTTSFFLMYLEITLFFVFVFHLDYFHESFDYEVPGREDVKAAGSLVLIDTVATIFLICGVNKDYSGRHQDLKRWWYCVPWILVYGLNTIGLFASGIIAFYQLDGQLKLIGLLPIGYGCFLLVFYILVIFFVLEQRHKLTGVAVRPIPSISSLVNRLD